MTPSTQSPTTMSPRLASSSPDQESIDSEGVAKLYTSQVFPHYGIPLKIISDCDTCFDSAFTKELCRLLGVKQNISSAYHPQTDGQSEHTNQSLEQYLWLYCNTQQDKWAEFLPLAQYVQNSWKHSTTRQTPYDTLIGYTPLAHQLIHMPMLPSTIDRLSCITEARTATQEALRKVQDRLTPETTRYKTFKVRSLVWLKGTNLK